MSAIKRSEYELPDAPDPLHYIPLAEHERALAALRDALACGMTRIAILGPPGFGKSLLLRRLKSDCPPASRIFYLPFANLGAEELGPWLLSWMGARAGSLDDDDFIKWARVEQRLGHRCVLLVDEAQSLSSAAAKRLDDWVVRAQGAIQVVLAGIESSVLDEVLGAFGPSLHRVGLRKPLRGEALRCFADALVERSVGHRGDAPTWIWEEQELFRLTEGVPRVVKAELRARLEKMARYQPAPGDASNLIAAQQVALPPDTTHFEKTRVHQSSAPVPGAPIQVLRKAKTLAPRRRRRWLPAAALLSLVGLLLWPSVQGPAIVAPSGEHRVAVHINAFPWASIRIDGEPVGITPLGDVKLAPGNHEVIATFPDGREMIKRIDAQVPSSSVVFP